MEALRIAAGLLAENPGRSLLTAPLSKEWVIRSGTKDFHGHTDYLATQAGCPVLMLMHGEHMSTIPITVHIPLKDVSSLLRPIVESDDFLNLLNKLKENRHYANSIWALAALNPHGGEGGLIGTEEEEYLTKTAEHWREQGIPVEGPFPSDGLFLPGVRQRYRLFLCPYHDQALIPFKALEGNSGVNVTVGLPYLRSSPDHGTAFGIAGKDRADPSSMIRALQYLLDA